jgi:nucleotide-binding universal stress UspA family protein
VRGETDVTVERIGAREPAGSRILLAHDLSASAEQAAALIAHTAWPASTLVRVVTSPAGIGRAASSFANLPEVRAHARDVRETIRAAHERLSTELRDAGLTVETKTIAGKPQRTIVAEADRFRADLIVVGARGQGSVAATLLGSVSRAVVENAPCSVLVARGTSVQRVLLAIDDSPPAMFATEMIARWPAFADSRVLLLAVAEPAPGYPRASLDAAGWRSAFRDTIASSADHACDVVENAIGHLDVRGGEVDVEIRLGDVAAEVAAAAREWPADLVTIGANARPLLLRLFVGSIPRKVLDSVNASVLVARPPSDDIARPA